VEVIKAMADNCLLEHPQNRPQPQLHVYDHVAWAINSFIKPGSHLYVLRSSSRQLSAIAFITSTAPPGRHLLFYKPYNRIYPLFHFIGLMQLRRKG